VRISLEWDELDEDALRGLAAEAAGCQFVRGYEGFAGRHAVAVNHLDLYRLDGLDVRDALDLDEYLATGSVTFMEWANPALHLLEEPSVVEIVHRTPTTRRVRLSGPLAARLSSKPC
jgi:tRNA A37 threonylcarbamoyladenosine biosynthesis protein TsaE